jgi:hypothetical protein
MTAPALSRRHRLVLAVGIGVASLMAQLAEPLDRRDRRRSGWG